MSRIDALKAEVESLPENEFTEFVNWLSEKDWERWDSQIDSDSRAGRLNFLVREAREAKSNGRLTAL